MAFLDLSTTPTGSIEAAPRLGAGTHNVTLTKLTFVDSKDKGLAVFTSADGGEFLEWLTFGSEGSKKRSRVFLDYMAHLAGVKPQSTFPSKADFDAFGHMVVSGCPALSISLIDDTYNGTTKAILDGYFDKAITAGVSFDPTADGF